MASKINLAFLIAILILPLAHADVGPSPAPPKVVVRIVEDGQPATSVTHVTYHCRGTDERNESGAVSPHPINLTCSDGVCTNDGGWYYKFNPCFGFPEGYFTYEHGGKEIRTETLDRNKSYENYDVTVDAPTGQITANRGSSCSLTGFILPAIVLGSLALGFCSRK